MTRIDIALGTYDGARFLGEQLDSIVAQSHQDWHLIARDDGSHDETVAILEAFRQQHADRVTLLHDDDGNLGFPLNFSRLLERSDAPYVALCDQDDVWFPDKLSRSLELLQSVETAAGPTTPAYVFSDLRVVDEQLATIDESYWSMTARDPGKAGALHRMLTQNVVTGCTMLINRPLCDAAVPIPPPYGTHDWWIATVGTALGASGFLTTPTLLYRQHGRNLSGATRSSLATLPERATTFVRRFRSRQRRSMSQFAQTAAFLERYRAELDPSDVAAIETYLELPHLGILRRGVRATRADLLPGGFAQSLAFVVLSDRRRWKAATIVNRSDDRPTR